MFDLHLSADEARLLREVLTDALSDLRVEVRGTDSLDFREMLHERKATLARIVDALGPEPAVGESDPRPAA
jgi:hypothetical protein